MPFENSQQPLFLLAFHQEAWELHPQSDWAQTYGLVEPWNADPFFAKLGMSYAQLRALVDASTEFAEGETLQGTLQDWETDPPQAAEQPYLFRMDQLLGHAFSFCGGMLIAEQRNGEKPSLETETELQLLGTLWLGASPLRWEDKEKTLYELLAQFGWQATAEQVLGSFQKAS